MELNIEAISCDDICCLCISKQRSIDISSFPNYEMPKYSEIILILTDVSSNEISKYPQGICDDCASKLIQFFEFREQIQNNLNQLKNIINNNDNEENKDLVPIQVEEYANSLFDKTQIEFIEESNNILKDDSMYLNDSTLSEDVDDDTEETKLSEDISTSIYNKNDDDPDELQESKFVPMTEQLSDEEQIKWQKKLDEWIKRQSNKKKKQQVHICDTCGKTYKTSYSLQDHLYVHTGQLNYECTECGRKFGQKKLLQSHMEVKHIKSKFFFCNTCGRRFNRKNNLLKHQWVHRDGGRFPCEHCGKLFKWENSLKAHLNTHSELRPHVCQLCNKSFKEVATLKKHCKSFHDGLGVEKGDLALESFELI